MSRLIVGFVVVGSLRKGTTVLVQNAGGGVGLAAIDIIKHFGGIAYGTASAGKHDFLKQRGYDYLIDYRNKDFAEEIMKVVGPSSDNRCRTTVPYMLSKVDDGQQGGGLDHRPNWL